MDIKALRAFVHDHADGVVIRMIDGTDYQLPHRDYVWFTPAAGTSGVRYGSSFWLHDPEKDETRLINAMLVKEVAPLSHNGGAANGRGSESE